MMIGEQPKDVAIKVMKGERDEAKYKQFIAEVKMVDYVRHKHLCRLIGYCMEMNRCILVYPFIPGGSLYDRLQHADRSLRHHAVPHQQAIARLDSNGIRGEPLTWMERTSIAHQVGKGLCYIHHDLEKPLLHRDIKSKNVMIEGSGNSLHACFIDFGLARPGALCRQEGMTSSHMINGHTVFTIAGTPGYMAPEYESGREVTAKNDVYAFGVVLLELVTGMRAITKTPEGKPFSLVFWAAQWLSRPRIHLSNEQLAEMVDPWLIARDSSHEREWEWDKVYALAMLGYCCTHLDPSHRPSMETVMDRIRAIL
ncbi:hypothetical protein CBR_g702 [Chara braunii]|uniref:Protein kinase domain-containing protein n=1 Tax=Chara braunii TaxID=69332 RepID=A0A388KCA1_CHABU|nr:hypothetical protein CBR_g702 [Chara braunii]|eukprot:GBG67573.1 hypothetical protein CBR_g702 [Chara braunii]